MPHFTIEYSANLDERIDMGALCRAVHKTILASGIFEIGAIRVRAVRADHYAIADQMPRNGFIDMVFRIGTGRSADDKKRVGEAIFEAARDLLAPFLAEPHFALSLEIREIDPVLSWKANSMHTRLR